MTIKTSATLCIAFAATVLAVGGSATAVNASDNTPITIVNNLEQPLEFKEISNREHVEIKSDPPQEILAHSSGKFKIHAACAGCGNEHLNIKYTIKGTDDQVGIVFKWSGGLDHCPKEHPDWVTETVKHCGNFDSSEWSYTFDRADN
jgi:ABC-type nickel/cobalt efflux system permease component RcnA